MKLQSNNLLETLSVNEVKNLTREVKETLCADFKIARKKLFTSAELWNIHRGQKNFAARRFYGY